MTAPWLRGFLLAGLLLPAASAAAQSIETTLTAFGKPARIAVAGLTAEEAEPAIRAAANALREAERLANPSSQDELTLGALNFGAGGGPRRLDDRLITLLERSLSFCEWSRGATGPLGGELLALWGSARPQLAVPAPAEAAAAAARASCDRLRLTVAKSSAEIPDGSRADLRGFAFGWAVDAATEALRSGGAKTGMVQLGPVARAFGPGPQGKGWRVTPPQVPGLEPPIPPIELLDVAYASASALDGELRAGNEIFAPYVDQRTGQPVTGVLAVLVLTELAVDAQGLAGTLFVTGSFEGQRRLGLLQPRPHVLWAIGSGTAPPLLVEYRWSSFFRGTRD